MALTDGIFPGVRVLRSVLTHSSLSISADEGSSSQAANDTLLTDSRGTLKVCTKATVHPPVELDSPAQTVQGQGRRRFAGLSPRLLSTY